MKSVLLRGPVLTQSGYGVHCRQICRWLLNLEKAGKIKLTCQVLPWGDTPWIIDSQRHDGLIGEVMKHSTPLTPKYDATFQLQLPSEWDSSLGNYNVGISAVVETDKCNPKWVEDCNKMNKVVVPSEFTKKVLTNSGVLLTEVKVIPESYPDCYRDSKTVDLNLNLQTKFNFLIVGQLTGNNPENDRKNIFYTIKWLCEAFKDDKDVGIIIKTNGGRNTRIDRRSITGVFTQLLAEVRPSGNPKVTLVHGELSEIEVYSLMKEPSVKALVSLTRGEGFGLPLLEAAAAGLPVIATNWSAHTEFLKLGRYIEIEHKLVDVHKSRIDNNIFVQGCKWAMPIEEQFKRKAKKFKESSSVPTEWALDLQTKILEKYSQENIASLYDAEFGSLL